MFLTLLAGIGGAASAGLNAYLPLLILALADRFTGTIDLDAPYDVISAPWGIVVLLILLPIELIADKIPRVDHLSDLLHSAIRPAAAAFMTMAITDERGGIDTVVALVIGLLVGVAVHGYKATARPHITVGTGGVGNPLVSMVEDVLCVVLVLVALFLPILLVVVLPLAAFGFVAICRKMRSGSATLRRLGGVAA